MCVSLYVRVLPSLENADYVHAGFHIGLRMCKSIWCLGADQSINIDE